MAETNGRGWKLAAILGGLLCASGGAISVGAIYSYGLVRDVGSLRVSGESTQNAITEFKAEQTLTRQQLRRLERAISRLADAQCYQNTGRPCLRDIMDEAP